MISGKSNWIPAPHKKWEEANAKLISRQTCANSTVPCPCMARSDPLRKVKPTKDWQIPDTARYEVCDRDTDLMTPLYIIHSFFVFLHVPKGFAAEVYHVGLHKQATNTVFKSTVFLQAVEDYKQDHKLLTFHHFIRSPRSTTGLTKAVLSHGPLLPQKLSSRFDIRVRP